jgi:PhnB protein
MTLNTYLNFDGRCEEAFKFYQKVLGGDIPMMMRMGESPMADQTSPEMKNKIMHTRLITKGQVLMGSDSPPEYFNGQHGFAVSVVVDTPEEAERIFAGLAENGSVEMPIAETFWAVRFGMLRDQFGIPWMVNCEKPM